MQSLLTILLLINFTPDEIAEYEHQSYKAMHHDQAQRAVYDGDRALLEQVFSNFNLALLNEKELRILRNMIYAQHGYSFNSPDLKEWFGQFAWYEPLLKDVDQHLTWVDSLNVEIIKEFEVAYKAVDNNIIEDEQLIGIWHASPVVAAGWGDLIFFYPNKRFRFEFNQMDWSKRLLAMSGIWHIQGASIVFEITEKKILQGGEIVEPYASCASDFAIEGGTTIIDTISPPEKMTFPISEIGETKIDLGEETPIPMVTIGTFDWYQFSTDPDSEMY